MKIRTGFVSNSSSSSFVCLGWTNDNIANIEEFKEKFKEYLIKNNIKFTLTREDTLSEIIDTLPIFNIRIYRSDDDFAIGFELSEKTSISKLKAEIETFEKLCETNLVYAFLKSQLGEPNFITGEDEY